MNNSAEKKAYKKRALMILILAGVCLILYLVMLLSILKDETVLVQEQDNERFFASTISNLNSNVRELNSLTDNFNENNAIMLNNLVISFSDGTFNNLKTMSRADQSELLSNATSTMPDCICLDVVDETGNIRVADNPEYTGGNLLTDYGFDITPESFKELYTQKTDHIILENPFYGENDVTGKQVYLYCEPVPASDTIDQPLYFVLGVSSDILDAAAERLSDLSIWLNGSTIGNNCAVFMVDKANDTINYGTLQGTDETGKTASKAGFKPEILKDSYKGASVIDGILCYISVRAYPSVLYGSDRYLVSAVPIRDLYSVNISVIIWNVCLFLIAILLIIAYSSFARLEALKKNENLQNIKLFSHKGKNVYFSRDLAAKILPVVLACAFVMFLFAFYFQSLLKLSDTFSESVSIEEEISRNVEESAKLQEDFLNYYDYQYESRAKLMSFIVAFNGEKYFDYDDDRQTINPVGNLDENGNRDIVKDGYGNPVYCISDSKQLDELKKANYVKDIYLISDSGITMATSSAYWNFSLSSDPKEQSFEFWDVLDGKEDALVQDVMINDAGTLSQYIGCSMHYYTRLGEDGNTEFVGYPDYVKQLNGSYDGNEITRHRGILQFEIDPEDTNTVIDSAKPEYILSNTRISNDGFLIGFAYNPDEEEYQVFYSPIESMMYQLASELGISERAFSGNYNGFQTIEGKKYLQSFRQVGDYYIATAMSMDSLYRYSMYTSVCCALFAIVVMFIFSCFTIFVTDMDRDELTREVTDPLAVFGHWQASRKWLDQSPSDKFEAIIKHSLIVLGIMFLASIILEANRYGNSSAILYIIGGNWDRGVHIFSLSACVVIVILSALVIKVFGHIAYLVAAAFGNRMITLMRLFISLIKAAAVVVVVFYCLYLMGIDATRLLASAGIMSVVVGLGAQSLVGDLLAGIFIVMEGSIHVGDYIMIDNVRGKVLEIGLRTTRYEDINQNIRIVCNNEIKAFANMSMKYSVVLYNIPVPYGEDYVRIRKILNAEFIDLYEQHRFLKGIPSCQGIEEFSDSSVNLRVKFMCEEGERYDVQRFMHDEIMHIFNENNIQIPFNQLDVHFDNEIIPNNPKE